MSASRQTPLGIASAIDSRGLFIASSETGVDCDKHHPLRAACQHATALNEAFARDIDGGDQGAERVRETGPAPASEDFGSFGTQWKAPSVFWFVGGTDPDAYASAKAANRLHELPVNHSPKFAPVIHPTLQTGIEALVVATRACLAA